VIGASGVVILADGARVPFEAGPREVVMWERYATANGLRTTPTEAELTRFSATTWVLYLAYASVTRGRAERPAFDEWLEAVADIADFDYGSVPPTPPVPSAEPSVPLPRGPESLPNRSGTLTRETSQPS
jgi:hypothetical protein